MSCMVPAAVLYFVSPQVTERRTAWTKPACLKPSDQKHQAGLLPQPHLQSNQPHSEQRRLTWSDCFHLPQPSKEKAPGKALNLTRPCPECHREGGVSYLRLLGTFWLLLPQLLMDNSLACVKHSPAPLLALHTGTVLWLVADRSLNQISGSVLMALRKARSTMTCIKARDPSHGSQLHL